MLKLYRSSVHPNQWIAQLPGAGWVLFPALDNGWEQRRPARGLDPLYLREASLDQASNTGILESYAADELFEVA